MAGSFGVGADAGVPGGMARRGRATARRHRDIDRSRSAVDHRRHLCARLPAAGMAMALRRSDHSLGREVAVLAAGPISRQLARARRMAIVVAECLCRLAGNLRSAIAALLAAACRARRPRSRDQPARLRCRDLRLPVPRRARHRPVLSRSRLACRRRAGGGAGLCVRRRRQCTHPAHRPGDQPRLSAAGALAHWRERSSGRRGEPGWRRARSRD